MPQVLVLYLAGLTLRSLCLTALAGMAAMCIRNVAVRHAIWAAVVCSMLLLLLPIADALLPAVSLPAPVELVVLPSSFSLISDVTKPAAPPKPGMPADRRAPESAAYDWWQLTAVAYFTVAALLLLRTGIAHRRVRNIRRSSTPITMPAFDEMVQSLQLRWRAPRLAESHLVRVPLTVGFFKPVILLPQAWSSWKDWDLRAVLAHELAHVRRADWAIAVMAGLNESLFWFNPFTWWLERHLCTLAEVASDEASLLLNGDAPRYAEVLLAFAAEARDGHRINGGVSMARHNIRVRIDRILPIRLRFSLLPGMTEPFLSVVPKAPPGMP